MSPFVTHALAPSYRLTWEGIESMLGWHTQSYDRSHQPSTHISMHVQNHCIFIIIILEGIVASMMHTSSSWIYHSPKPIYLTIIWTSSIHPGCHYFRLKTHFCFSMVSSWMTYQTRFLWDSCDRCVIANKGWSAWPMQRAAFNTMPWWIKYQPYILSMSNGSWHYPLLSTFCVSMALFWILL